MNKTAKKYLGIGIAAVIIGGGILLFSQRSTITDDSTETNLYPEQAITHGHGLAVDVQDPSKLYIATHHGLLLLVNETDLYRVGQSQDDYMGFSVHPTESNIFFSSGHPSVGGNIGFQQSEDSGITWEKISAGVNGPVDFHSMAVSSVNPKLVYGWYQGDLQRSLDQGKTWEIVNRDLFAVALAADSQDENTVYAATPHGQGVMMSKDKGLTWVSVSPELEGGAVSMIAVHPTDASILLIFSERLDGLGKSIDHGKTWQPISENFNNETILYLAFDKNSAGVLYALTDQNAIYKSADTAETWSKIL